jgi:3-dehydroquinate synthase
VESDGDTCARAVTPVEIGAGAASYRAHIGAGLLDRAGELIAKVLAPSPCAIISDTKVAPLFGERLERSLMAAGFKPIRIMIPPGEDSKRLEQVGSICDQMIGAGLDRGSTVVGLGGGVIGDISGFVAAIYHRGIPHVQIPTTLLAMVDSSIGGKTGVNSASGKNLLGAVHHPSLVIDDIDVLKTLPARELNQGFAEIVKHAIIADAEMFRDLRGVDRGNLAPLIQRNIAIKAKIVAQDELDRTGARAVLNFGHTIGHAIERAGDYGQFLHGEAISLGMVAAAAISLKRAGLSAADNKAIVELLKSFALPTELPENFPREKILAALAFDKKFEQGAVRFVVTPAIGSARLSKDVTTDDLREAVETLVPSN